jgi:protein phosphatase
MLEENYVRRGPGLFDSQLSFSRELRLPRNTLVVLSGAAGSGKSTFASKHFLPTQIISSDQCRALICDDPADQAVSGAAFDLMHDIIEKRLRLSRLTVADATHLKPEERRPLIRLASRFGFSTAMVAFDVPLGLCLARNGRRERVVPEQAIRTQHALMEKTLRSIDGEAFDYMFVLDELTADEVTVALGRRVSRRPAQPVRRR